MRLYRSLHLLLKEVVFPGYVMLEYSSTELTVILNFHVYFLHLFLTWQLLFYETILILKVFVKVTFFNLTFYRPMINI